MIESNSITLSFCACVDRYTSAIEKKKKSADCKDANYLKQQLNPGRSCSVASQCKSRNCQEVCIGYEKGGACYEHADCVEGFYCHQDEDWPFKTICKEYQLDGKDCTEDY